MKRKISRPFRTFFRSRFIIILILLIQIFLFANMITATIQAYRIFNVIFQAISIGVSIYVVAQNNMPETKLTWIFVILLVPVFGGFFYILVTNQSRNKKFKRSVKKTDERIHPYHFLSADEIHDVEQNEKMPTHLVKYLQNSAGFPVSSKTQGEYFELGEIYFERLLEELEKAEKYIFLEFFILQEGIMWNSILEVLERKLKQGVLVRVMIDDMGSFIDLPKNYKKKLDEIGIECTIFNPFVPVLSTLQNNRDHRKIVSIDGKIAFTGGVNLADEYINALDKFGHWKDSGIKVEGKAAWNLTVVFLMLWNSENKLEEDFKIYYPGEEFSNSFEYDGYYQPYADSPVDSELVSENVYMTIIQSAKKYLYICTPYLVVGDKLLSALKLAAKSGVDVRIITPYRWDKWFVHAMTKVYYRELIDSGVKIYEYSLGFMHAKSFVSDDITAVVGTINLDYRSLYLHFECGIAFYDSPVIYDVKADFLATLRKCHEITVKDCKYNVFLRLLQDVLRIFSPLL